MNFFEDFNKLDFEADAKCFQPKLGIKFPARGSNTLDLISTNLQDMAHRLLAEIRKTRKKNSNSDNPEILED